MRPETRDALVDALHDVRTPDGRADDGTAAQADRGTADARRLVEVGVGNRTDVAAGLVAAGDDVVATDVVERTVPADVRFVRDDVTDPRVGVYRGADVVYALNCPPELHRALWDVARAAGAACCFTTLGAEGPAVPVERRTLPGETLFVARGRN